MTSVETLLLLRHATAKQGPPGGRDADRPLSDRGRREAAGVGAFLRDAGLRVDHVLCSPAVRTQETLGLALGAPAAEVVVELVTGLYQASADELLALVAELDAATVLVVGHAPAVPAAVDLLADPTGSSAAALAAVAHRYPPGTLARLSVGTADPAAASAVLAGVRIPDGSGGEYFA